MQNLIIRPVITEKSIAQANNGKYTFVVDKVADKLAIKRAVEKTFSVKVVKVVTTLVKGKTKRVGTRRTEIVASSWKKATVLLVSGQKIDLFEVAG
jgi:large subunit ribosomal protein L23